jgi:hypothetical protein
VLDRKHQSERERSARRPGPGRQHERRVGLRVERTLGIRQILVQRVELVSGDWGDDGLAGRVVNLDLGDDLPRTVGSEHDGGGIAGSREDDVEDDGLQVGIRLERDLRLRPGGQ